METELHFKTTSKNKWYCYGALLFLLFANQTFGQTTRYVQAGYGIDMGDCTGAVPCATIGYAIGQSDSGDLIEIANGTYTESITIDKELTINGESENGTIIQAAEMPGTAENRVVLVNPGSGSEVSLSNLTIRYGSIVGDGAGIFQDYDSMLNLSNVTIKENEAKYDGMNGHMGGGLFSNGHSTLNNVTFSDNTAHGGAGMFSGSPFGNQVETILTNVAFIGNIAAVYGGGLSTQMKSSATLTNVSFTGNQVNDGDGGGIHNIFNTVQQVYKNVTFTNNVATRYGGGLYSDSSAAPELVNAVFSDNMAEMGGAMGFFFSDPPTLTNVTISNNTATDQGGGIYSFFTSEINIINSIIWGNTSEGQGNEIYNPSNPTNISYSIYKNDSNDIVGTINASNSLTEDPLFVDAGNGLFQLTNESPGVNTGNPDTDLLLFPGGPDDPLDLDNNPRVFGNVIDIGAYENQTALTCVVPTDILVDNVTPTSADISWTENGNTTEWEIEYGESGFTQGEGTIVVDNDGILGETLTDLSPATEYDVYVRAVCTSGQSEWSESATFTTEALPCFPPSDISFDNITPTTADISWTENGTANEWEIEYGLNGFLQGEGTIIIDNDGVLGETISDLTPDTLYDVYVRSICSGNESEWVGHLTFITEEELSISENSVDQLVLYPNPTTGIINLQTQKPIKAISVYNLAGQKVSFNSLNQENTSIDISNLTSGIYFIEIILNDKTIKKHKVIKK